MHALPNPRSVASHLSAITSAALAACAVLAALPACELRTPPAPITVYSPNLGVSFPLPQGWTADPAVEQAGFHMQTFTGRSVDVPERPGIRVQVLAGPAPDGDLEEVAARFRRDLIEDRVDEYHLYGFEGRSWYFVSEDGEERAQVMLVDVEGRLYGLYVRGEARTVEAYRKEMDLLWRGFSIERVPFFDVYAGPEGDIVIPHPRNWKRTQVAVKSGESLFVAFRSRPLAVEGDGTTVHVTLEVTVNRAPPDLTVERFYAARTEILGESYRLLEHNPMPQSGAIETVYYVETQLAEYLERTLYVVRDQKSFIYKFNCRNRVYRVVEPWIDEIVRGFLDVQAAPVPGNDTNAPQSLY